MIAPALAPATLIHLLDGLRRMLGEPAERAREPQPLHAAARNTASASSIHCIVPPPRVVLAPQWSLRPYSRRCCSTTPVAGSVVG